MMKWCSLVTGEIIGMIAKEPGGRRLASKGLIHSKHLNIRCKAKPLEVIQVKVQVSFFFWRLCLE